MIQQPLLFYSFKMAERLHMSQREIMRRMDYKEMLEWMAYDMASNPEFRDKTYKEIDLEEQRKYTAEQEATRMMNFFKGMGNG